MLVLVVALLLATTGGLFAEQDFDGDDSRPLGMAVTEIGHVGSGAAAVIGRGAHKGADVHWWFARHGAEEPEELWWRYWIRFPPGFRVDPPSRGKLPGPAGLTGNTCFGGRPPTDRNPCFSARMMFSRLYGPGGQAGPDDQTLLGFYVYHLDSPPHRGDIWGWDPAVATLTHGEWYCVEGRIRLNTPGRADGLLQGWVDGEEAFSRTDISFRRDGRLKVRSFWFDVYYGGKASSPERNRIEFDSFAWGPDRVGCDDADFAGAFSDDEHSPFEPDIDWLADRGITSGCGPNHFCPDRPISRGQLAALLAKAADLEPSPDDHFADDDGSPFEQAINALAAAGATTGCAADRFCPDRPATRGEIALFLYRLGGLPDAGHTGFVDVAGTAYEAAARSLAGHGITRGCNPPANDRFCADGTLTRAQAAALIRRWVDAVEAHLPQPDEPPEDRAEPASVRISRDLWPHSVE
jgi:hypothetical protein